MLTSARLGIAAALLLTLTAAPAFAGDPAGMGNFRRAEAIRAARVDPTKATVMGLATANNHLSAPAAQPATARVLVVGNHETGKVTLVSAPLDRSQPVKALTTKEANKLGLVTQSQARRQVERNGGELGAPGRVAVVDRGLTKHAGYQFDQAVKAPFHPKVFDRQGSPQETVSAVVRTVTVNGKGESAGITDYTYRDARIKLDPVTGPTGKTFVRSSETGALFLKSPQGSTLYVDKNFKNDAWLSREYKLVPADLPAGYLHKSSTRSP